MKMQPLLVLPLITLLVHEAAGFPTEVRAVPGQDKYASWDDVNVVAHGLLQLGQALKENVDKSKVQMRDVNAKLKDFNGRVDELEKKQQEQDEALKARGTTVEEMEKRADEMREKVEEVQKQSTDINSRIDRLEEKVEEVLKEPQLDSNYSDDSEAPFIQRLLTAQNRRIDQLVEKIKQQQEKLEKQSLHLQALQNKVKQKRAKSNRQREEGRGGVEQSRDAAGLPADCHDLFLQGQRVSGVYTVKPKNSQPFNVLCEMTAEGGWTVIQKRQDGSQNFNQLWESYKKGFGSMTGEFWLGLENVHSLSEQGPYVLQVELGHQAGEQQTVQYQFKLDGEDKKFSVHLQQETPAGDQGEAFTTGPSGLPFSTADQDNDLAADVNCAEMLSGGWWFSSCGETNLNGRYPSNTGLDRGHTMFWTSTRGQNISLKTAVLKIIPAAVKS